MKTSRRQERVREDRRSLRCGACGAGNRLSESAKQDGWFRCAFCDSPEPVPGVGDFAIQGPVDRITRVVRPGSSEFEVGPECLLPLGAAIIAVAAADLAIGATLHLAGRLDPALAASLTPYLIGALALCGVAALFGSATRQRLEIADGRAHLCWITLGRSWHHRRIRTERFHTVSYASGRTGVEVRAPGKRIFVRVPGLDSARWLERQIVEAVKDARSGGGADRLPCPGCGGPVAEEKVLRDAGGIECPHCQTGLVQTRGGIAMPTVLIEHSLKLPKGSEPARSQRDGDARVWNARPWCSTHPLATPFNLAIAFALDTAVIGGSWWCVWATPMLQVVVGGMALGITLGVLNTIPWFLVNVFGRHRFRLSPRYLDHDVRIGPWEVRRHRIAFSRLLELHARQKYYDTGDGERLPLGSLEVEVRLAAHTLMMEPYGPHLLPVVREVIEAIPEHLVAMGRRVYASKAPGA